jgi:hypothetical protein
MRVNTKKTNKFKNYRTIIGFMSYYYESFIINLFSAVLILAILYILFIIREMFFGLIIGFFSIYLFIYLLDSSFNRIISIITGKKVREKGIKKK